MNSYKKNDILEVVKNFSRCRIMVIGDIIADEYVFGKLSRISREAPVLILKHEESTIVPGGGGNAAANVSALGGQCFIIGFIGNDVYAARLKESIRKFSMNTDGLIHKKAHSIVKTRILAGGNHTTKQQLLRIDREEKYTYIKGDSERISACLDTIIHDVDGILISDYGLGTVHDKVKESVLSTGNAEGKIIGVDSRYDLLKYRNISIATPNEWEMRDIITRNNVSQDDMVKYGIDLKKKIKSENLIITQGSSGMTIFDSDNRVVQLPVIGSDEVADVTGCGDTVISTVMLALVSGLDIITAGRIANHAGAIAVTKRGTSVVYNEELVNHINKFWEDV